MTNEEINRLIHEQIMGECWHEITHQAKCSDSGAIQGHYPYCAKCDDWCNKNPPYCTDLNAVARAEAKVIKKRGGLNLLCAITEAVDDGGKFSVFATARQRAEACLRAMDLWRDDA